jgi:hypothetical protein
VSVAEQVAGKPKNSNKFSEPNSEPEPNLIGILFKSIGELPIRHAQGI